MVKFYLKVELRRVEGIFLQEAIPGNLERETLQKTREFALKLTRRIPEILRGMLLNQRIRATVTGAGRDYVILRLNSGEEILVRNVPVLGLNEGEEVVLQLVSKNPYVLKVVSSKRLLKATAGILKNLDKLRGFPFNRIRSFEGFKNSGLFYERKLFRAILEKRVEEFSRDLKYQALVKNDAERLELITLLQAFSLEQGREKLFLPVGEDGSTKLVLRRTREGFRFLIEISLEEDILLLELEAPKEGSFINLRVFSSSPELLRKLEGLERLNTQVPIVSVEKRVLEPSELRRIFLRELAGSTVLNLRV